MKTLQAAPPAFIERCGGLLPAMLYTYFINACRKGESAIMFDNLVGMTGEKKSTILAAMEDMSATGLLKGYTANETGFVIQDLVITVGGPAQPGLFDDKSTVVSREKRLYDDVQVGDTIYRGQVEEIKQGDATLYYRLKITARDSGTSVDDATLKMDMSEKFGNAKLAFDWFDDYVHSVEEDGPQPSEDPTSETVEDPVVDTAPATIENPLDQIRRLIEANFIPRAAKGKTKVLLAPESYKAALKANKGRMGDANGVFTLVENATEGIELDGYPEPKVSEDP